MEGRNVYSIPAGAPFLNTLVEALTSGQLVPGFSPGADPFALADVTLYLPTRRAARAIRESFLSNAGRPVLLPRILTLGDIDEDQHLFAPGEPSGAGLPPAISGTERQLALATLVLGWSRALVRRAAELPEEDEELIPASPADAVRLAASLGALIDQVSVQPDGWAPLFTELDADLARYFEITRDFLRIATESWPQYLDDCGLLDPGVRRDRLVRAEAARYAQFGASGPVIAAGSTGSVPATAILLEAVSRLPNGAVVLPGLDLDLDEESWAAVGPSDEAPAGAVHPQYGLKRLLESLGLQRRDVRPLGQAPAAQALRSRFVSDALRPAVTTDRWSTDRMLSPAEIEDALAGVALVEAANEREEALAVALILRQAVETPDGVAALVTPDRGLARRVAAEMRRWDIAVDDSAGRPLATAPAGVLARLTAEVALGGCRAEPLLALLKHPLAGFGLPHAAARRAARALERAVLRGPRLRPGLAALRHAFDQSAALAQEHARTGTTAAQSLTKSEWTEADDLLSRVTAALDLLAKLADSAGSKPVGLFARAHRACLAEVTAVSEGPVPLYGEAEQELFRLFDEVDAAQDGPKIAARDYPALFAALLDGRAVRRRGGLDPRVHIWGTLEARLQSVDVVVLGSLNEGSWPSQTELDPLLSRAMRAALALDPPERRLGLSAHDFTQGLGQPEVWLTRAERHDGEPRVPSRWVQRLLAVAGPQGAEGLRHRAAAILACARGLDRPAGTAAPGPRSCPKPALALRPRRLSATQIETLIRDPYAIYARQVLRLRALEPLARLPEAAERGNLFHAILERFIRGNPSGPYDDAALDDLLRMAREEFAAFEDFPEIAALWWPRFEKLARWFVTTEAARIDVARRVVENRGALTLADGFELTARADRIDLLTDGSLVIVDYKTGTPPGNDEVLSLSPQLPLEALIATKGGFSALPAGPVSRLEYIQISGHGEGGKVHERGTRIGKTKPDVTLPEAIALTEMRLVDLVSSYRDPETGYLSRKIPQLRRQFAGDYDHLARVAEWQVADEDAEA